MFFNFFYFIYFISFYVFFIYLILSFLFFFFFFLPYGGGSVPFVHPRKYAPVYDTCWEYPSIEISTAKYVELKKNNSIFDLGLNPGL